VADVAARTFAVPYSRRGSEFGEEEIEAVADLLRGDAPLAGGEQRELFEREFADYVGARHALALPNCTLALELVGRLLDLGPDDAVVTTPQTYQATSHHLLLHPGDVRFCDIDDNTLAIDAAALEGVLGTDTRAIFMTHHGGLMGDMDPIMELAESRGVTVVEDAAHALGSTYRGRRAGSTAHLSCFSFTSFKNMSSLGEGGMITFDEDGWLEPLTRLRSIEAVGSYVPREVSFGGRTTPDHDLNRHAGLAYTHDCTGITAVGSNGTMSEAAAAVGRIQLRRLGEANQRRAEIARHFDEAVGAIDGFRLQEVPEDRTHSHHLYTFFVGAEAGVERDELGAALEEEGVEIHLRYFPLHLLPEWRWRGHALGECPRAEQLFFEEHMNLPIYPAMHDAQVEHVVASLRRAVARLRATAPRRSR
jgi:perosamine synthetase